ncbi:MAG: hypothetical protein M9944_22450 [Rhizobiaceae bacterium]|nr:hypothetical protein [Rhizobiaceae bacterium]
MTRPFVTLLLLLGLADMLGSRHDSDLRPLGMDRMPSELRPVLTAINGLFSRTHTARGREKSFTAFARMNSRRR